MYVAHFICLRDLEIVNVRLTALQYLHRRDTEYLLHFMASMASKNTAVTSGTTNSCCAIRRCIRAQVA